MIYYETELYHHGVKGMKWGVRKQKEKVRDARRQYQEDLKNARRASGFFVKSPDDPRVVAANKAVKKAQTSELRYIREKANLKKAKGRNELKFYRNEMYKSGAPGSAADVLSGGRSTRIYNDLKKRKGKAYAEQVFSKTKNMAVTAIAVSSAAAVGLTVASVLINR